MKLEVKNSNNKLSPFEDRFPLLFEIVPPAKENKEKRLQQHIEYLERLFNETTVDGINIPEIQEETGKSDKGKRRSEHKERVEPREYVLELRKHFDTEYMINRVVVNHYLNEHEPWFIETHNDYDIHNLILVGGELPMDKYNTPSVPETTEYVKSYLNKGKLRATDGTIEPTDFDIGNICIPTRRLEDFDEPDRMIMKMKSGTDFFTTQIMFESDSVNSLIEDFSHKLAQEKMDPPMIFWTFSPVSSKKDIDFLRWLGVYIPESTEEKIINSENPVEQSVEEAVEIWERIKQHNLKLPVPIPMGIHISVMGPRNLGNGIEIAKRFNEAGVPH